MLHMNKEQTPGYGFGWRICYLFLNIIIFSPASFLSCFLLKKIVLFLGKNIRKNQFRQKEIQQPNYFHKKKGQTSNRS